MSTPPTPPLSISAKYLGPIFSLDGELTSKKQNLIFARNGTGKSFLSRALLYLDKHHQKEDIGDAPLNLISDESPEGKGEFTIFRDTQVLGALSVKKSEEPTAQSSDTIFHVFSEDFVHAELRERSYNLDGNIENQIAIDSETIQLKDAQEALAKAQEGEETAVKALREAFEKDKFDNLFKKASINKKLKEYSGLAHELDEQIVQLSEKPDVPAQNFTAILKDLDDVKSLPSEPVYPDPIDVPTLNGIDLRQVNESLQKITSPSSVSDAVKQKIEKYHAFYKTGVEIVKAHDFENCPFCNQGITGADPKSVIDTYIKYFEDEEERHKTELRALEKSLNTKYDEITGLTPRFSVQGTRYDALKRFLPSQKEETLNNVGEEIKKACEIISSYKEIIERKTNDLSSPYSLPDNNLGTGMKALGEKINENNSKISTLTEAVNQSNEERITLQRKACEVFVTEFIRDHWGEIQQIKALRNDKKEKAQKLQTLESSGPSTEARVRVAETFELLLRDFFAEKYIFNKEDFTLRRGEYEMTRGPHRTLSDGEKTAIAFCYFIASMHKKVQHNSDYQKLFLVFDDPVTSMSYDYIFDISLRCP